MKFLHAADLHLGLRITRFEEAACGRIVEARFAALEQLRAKAAEHHVDFVLIAGDVFDDHTVSRSTAERAFTIFEGKHMPCPVYIIPGNHDPLTPGGVWDRLPWSQASPPKNVFLLRQRNPVRVANLPVTLFPCPLHHRNSIDDPTAWIADFPRQERDSTIRIGLAHGSLKFLPQLPEDDHLIRADAAEHYGLDYLALGHWHKPLPYKGPKGVVRAAYSGTHEPMRFPGSSSISSSGWSSYSRDADGERFEDAGRGAILLVTIDEAGAPPQIEELEIGQLRWLSEQREVSSEISIGSIISEFAQTERPERTMLRLRLFGVLDPQSYARVEEVLEKIVRDRYHAGSSLDASGVLIQPEDEQLQQIVGDGVLSRILARLQEDADSNDEATKRVAAHALGLLFRIAWEAQQS